jgi:hypothetical protein
MNERISMASLGSIGSRIAASTAVATLLTFAIAFLTPPLSGPFCVSDCFEYPYAGIAGRFPRDYYWMYPAQALMVLYVFLAACLHLRAADDRKAVTLPGLVFAAMASLILMAVYFVQVTVIQPSLLARETDGIALLSQYNPHGVFIALEELGYLMMSLSFPCLAAGLPGRGGMEKAARWALRAGFLLSVAALAGITAAYGVRREYRFEVAVIGIDMLVLLIVSTAAAIHFRRIDRSED